MRAILLSALFVTAAVLAGCVSDMSEEDSGAQRVGPHGTPIDELGRPIVPADWAERALAADEGHDHENRSHHTGRTTPNFVTVGHNPLITDWYGKTAGDHGCGATVERDGRALNVVQSFASDVAFVLTDVTDRANPKKVGELVMESTQVYDVTLSPDLRHVVLATSPLDSGPDRVGAPVAEAEAIVPIWRDACTGTIQPVAGPEAGLPYASGIVLVNIENPQSPYVADFRNFPVLGGHSVRVHEADGRTLVLTAVSNGGEMASYYVLMEITDSPTGGLLSPLSVIRYVPQDPMDFGEASIHDGYIQKHPLTGTTLAYLAHGGNGLVLYDIDDPRNPVFVSRWNGWDVLGEHAPAFPFIHEALPTAETWDGRHYTFIGEECSGRSPANPTCLLYAIDTTDPSAPSFVGAWTLPVDVQWDHPLQYSLHYIGLMNRTLLVTAYHGGMWAVDVSTPEALRTMPTVGVYLPELDSPEAFDEPPRSLFIRQLFGNIGLDNKPSLMDLDVLSDGTIVTHDLQAGLFTVRFDPTYPVPIPQPWPLTYNESG